MGINGDKSNESTIFQSAYAGLEKEIKNTNKAVMQRAFKILLKNCE